jgi:putative endonuclease
MDRIEVSEAFDSGSIPDEATKIFYTYVLQSINNGSFYKGHCSDLNKRLLEHNQGKTKSIKQLIPFKIIYFETFDDLNNAIKREKYFKSAAGRKFLKQKLELSEALNLGSLPD